MTREYQSLLKIYVAALLISGVFYVFYWFAPWLYGGLASETQGILSYGGYGAWFEVPEWVSWALFSLIVASYVGMLFFKKVIRLLFLFLKVFAIIISPVYGMNVITGVEVLIIDTSTLLSGFVLGLAYFSPLKDRFD